MRKQRDIGPYKIKPEIHQDIITSALSAKDLSKKHNICLTSIYFILNQNDPERIRKKVTTPVSEDTKKAILADIAGIAVISVKDLAIKHKVSVNFIYKFMRERFKKK